MIAPCYQESVANEVLSTVGGVRFIKWAQDPLVSFVKCEPPSILPCGGDKHYNAFKDVLVSISFSVIVNLEWHLRQRVMLKDPTSQPLKSSPHEDWFAKWCIHVLLIKNPDLVSAFTLDPDLWAIFGMGQMQHILPAMSCTGLPRPAKTT